MMHRTVMSWALAATIGLAGLGVPDDSEARRLGGGRASGMQRDMPARTAPDAPPPKPAAPVQQAAPAPAGATAAAPAAAAAKRSWMGPLAGLAAGLGLAALMSHLGLGEAFGQFLLLALLAVITLVAVRWVMRRMAKPAPVGALRSAGVAGGHQVAWPAAGGSAMPPPAEPAGRVEPALQPEPAAGAAAIEPPAAAPAVAKAFVPAAFDSEGFARTAKMIFIRLQAANDARDLDDLRSFTTPEMFAELSLDIQDRGTATQHTEVVKIDAQVLDVAEEATRQIVSVRFRGELIEAADAGATPVDEVWHLVKPVDGSRNWAIAGIEPWQ